MRNENFGRLTTAYFLCDAIFETLNRFRAIIWVDALTQRGCVAVCIAILILEQYSIFCHVHDRCQPWSFNRNDQTTAHVTHPDCAIFWLVIVTHTDVLLSEKDVVLEKNQFTAHSRYNGLIGTIFRIKYTPTNEPLSVVDLFHIPV